MSGTDGAETASGGVELDADVRPWLAGQRVARYQLITPIASGGMAEIWLAKLTGAQSFEKVVVVKRLLAKSENDAHMVKMFLEEARIASTLEHPNIAQVLELGEHDGNFFMAMEYLHGENLSHVARRARELGVELPAEMCVRLVSTAAEGLGYAHNKRSASGEPLRIVHRDVSPQNVMVTYEGVVKVVDFGIAHAAHRAIRTATGAVKGKLAYMAPEQARSEKIDASADVFALGVMLFELLTQTRLYDSPEEVLIIRRLISGEPFPRPKARKSSVPSELDALVAQTMDLNPLVRFATGRELHAALERWLHTQPKVPGQAEVEQLMEQLFADRKQRRQELMTARVVKPGTDPFAISKESMPGASDSTHSTLFAPRGKQLAAVLAAALGLVLFGVGAARMATGGEPAPAPHPVVAAPVPVPAPAPAPVEEHRPPPEAPVKEAPAPAVAEPKKAPAPAAKGGYLTLQTEPWTQVFLGKTLLGDTPLVDVPVPAGDLKLRLVNDDEHVNQTVEVEVRSGKTTIKRLKL